MTPAVLPSIEPMQSLFKPKFLFIDCIPRKSAPLFSSTYPLPIFIHITNTNIHISDRLHVIKIHFWISTNFWMESLNYFVIAMIPIAALIRIYFLHVQHFRLISLLTIFSLTSLSFTMSSCLYLPLQIRHKRNRTISQNSGGATAPSASVPFTEAP